LTERFVNSSEVKLHVQYPLTRKCSFCFAKCSCSCGTCSIES